MNTMKWLIKREFWEHKGGFFWAPIVFGAIMVLLVMLSLLAMMFGGDKTAQMNGMPLWDFFASMTDLQKADFARISVMSWYGIASTTFSLLYGFTAFFFCLNALFDERKDRSILFWKSLPITDEVTVISKAIFATMVAPAIALGVAIITSVLALLLTCLMLVIKDVGLASTILALPLTYLVPLQWIAALPIYVLWALPTVGWLLMVGAWARSKPLLWAVLIPVLAYGLITWLNKLFQFGWDLAWFQSHIVLRMLFSAVPGSWFKLQPLLIHDDRPELMLSGHALEMLSQSWQLVGTANLWIGVVAGGAMIYAASRIRRWKDEG